MRNESVLNERYNESGRVAEQLEYVDPAIEPDQGPFLEEATLLDLVQLPVDHAKTPQEDRAHEDVDQTDSHAHDEKPCNDTGAEPGHNEAEEDGCDRSAYLCGSMLGDEIRISVLV